jgi:hypothetical protein
MKKPLERASTEISVDKIRKVKGKLLFIYTRRYKMMKTAQN